MFATDIALKDKTISYNGIQFGGSESDFNMAPPDFSLSAQYVYDDTDRSVKHSIYRLRVATIVTQRSLTTAAQAQSDNDIKWLQDKLGEPGKRLTLNIGAGLGEITVDYNNGPKPRVIELTPLGGNTAWSLTWEVEFTGWRCPPDNTKIESFYFSTIWSMDESGKTIRTISGAWTVPVIAGLVADSKRQELIVSVPPGFRRVSSNYSESPDKRRMDFAITDVEFGDDYAYPFGVVQATGSRNIASSGPAFVQGAMTLQMTLTMSPGHHRSLAALHFFREAMAMQAAFYNSQVLSKDTALIPQQISVSPQLFDNARTTSFSMAWSLTGCILDFMLSQETYKPVEGTNYTQWRTSIDGSDEQRAWDQRGFAQLASNPAENVVINTCTPYAERVTIGVTPKSLDPLKNAPKPYGLGVPDIPEETSWLAYDVQIRVKHEEYGTYHRKAIAHQPEKEPAEAEASYLTRESNISAQDQTRTEWAGKPTQLVLLQFKGLRVQHTPEPPTLESVGGKKVLPTNREQNVTKIVGHALGTPIYQMQFAQVYRVTDEQVIAKLEKRQKDISMCARVTRKEVEYAL